MMGEANVLISPEKTSSSPNLLHRFFRRFFRTLLRWRERVHVSEEAWHLTLAGGVGVIGGLINLGFISLADGLARGIGFVTAWGGLSGAAFAVIAVPALGGLLAGLVLFLGLHYVRRQGTASFLEAVFLGDGRLKVRTALVNGLSSLLSIATGATIGREGSITQLTATTASGVGQFFDWPPYRLRLLVACGAAAGMAAAYNAPIAGAVFAAHIVLGNFAMNLFAPLVFSSVIATIVSRSFMGAAPLYDLPAVTFDHFQLPWFLVLGLVAGLLAAGFQKALRASERILRRLPLPVYGRLALGGAMVGVLALAFPGVTGNGYEATSRVLHGELEFQGLVGLMSARFLATVVVVGVGTLGGVFTPTLFLGAGLGGLFYYLLAEGMGISVIPIAGFALVGMGGVLAGTTHAPLLAMIMIFELTLNYSLMPPLMLTCVISTLVARSIHSANVYSEGLELKGLSASWETEKIGAGTRRRMGDLMQSPTQPLQEVDTFETIADRFLSSTYHFLPVVDVEQRLKGVVALEDLKGYLAMGEHLKSVIALDVMRPPPEVLTPDQRLDEAISTLLSSEMRRVPVVNKLSEMKLIGVVVRSEALGLLSEAIAVAGTTRGKGRL